MEIAEIRLRRKTLLVIVSLVAGGALAVALLVDASGTLHFAKAVLPASVLFAIQVIGLFGLGALVLRRLRWVATDSPPFLLYSVVLGIGLFSYAVFAVGILRLLVPSIAILLLGLLVLCGVVEFIRLWRAKFFSLTALAPADFSLLSLLLVCLIGLNLLYPIFSTVFTPPREIDEIAYHLSIPQIYIDNHQILYIPFIPQSNWPLGVEMLYTFELLLGQEALTHLISWLSMGLVTTGIILLGRSLFSGLAGLVAAAIFSGTPIVVTLAGTALIDIPLTMFTFFAVAAFLLWVKQGNRGGLLLSAVLAGMAASTKLNGASIAVILGFLVFLHSWRQAGLRAGVKDFFIYGSLSFLFVLPWYLKSWVMAGNPVWPFLDNLFPSMNWDATGGANLLNFIQAPNFPLTAGNFLTGLWKLTRYPSEFGVSGYALGWTYLILALPVLFVFRRGFGDEKRKYFYYLGTIFLGLYSIWFATTHQTRFLLSAMPVMALMIGAGVESGIHAIDRTWYRNACLVALVTLLGATHWMTDPAYREKLRDSLPFLTGKQDRHQYLQGSFEGYSVFRHINEELPEDANLLAGLFEVRGYYLDRKYFWANPIAQRVYRFEEFSSVEALKARLSADGFTHILYNPRYEDSLSVMENGERIASIFRQLLGQAIPVYSEGGIELYELPRP